jgi:hypothetical protein
MNFVTHLSLCSALEDLDGYVGKTKSLQKHAETCVMLRPEVFGSNLRSEVLAEANKASNKENISPPSGELSSTQLASSSSQLQTVSTRPIKRARTSKSLIGGTATWSVTCQDDFHADFCKFLIANGCAWLVENNPQTCLFLDKWIPGAPKPDRKHLSGPVLDAEVKRVEDVV